MRLDKDVCEVLYTPEELQKACKEMGKRLTADYEGKDLVAVAILNGAVVFFTDLIREIDLPLDIDFMAVSSYGSGTTSTGKVKLKKDLNCDIAGRDVLIIEDILDSGRTLKHLVDDLKERHPASIKVAVLLDKPARREEDIHADYVGYTILDAFVVGYGLDYAEKYRNLPYVGILDPSVYAE